MPSQLTPVNLHRPAFWHCPRCNALHDAMTLLPCLAPARDRKTASQLDASHGAAGWALLDRSDVAAWRLRSIGQARHGADWWKGLAADLGVGLRTLERAAAGRDMPAGFWRDVLALVGDGNADNAKQAVDISWQV